MAALGCTPATAACLGTAAVAGAAGAAAAGSGACGPAAAAGCGGAACGCEVAGAPVMSYVGSARGAYIQETTYKYVGNGAGEFEVVAPRSTNYCLFLLPCLGLLGLLLLLLLLWPATTTTTTGLPYDCGANLLNWQSEWSIAQQAWCCQNAGRGCTTTTLAATQPFVPPATTVPVPRSTTPEPFNCNEGGVPSWSPEKREYCCRVYKNGCPTLYPPPTPPPPQFDCAAGYANWVAAWSVEQKAWCCKNTGKGCPGAGGCETTAAPFDCAANYPNWQLGWSAEKKAWCCQHTGKGCAAAVPCPTSYR